MSVQDSIVWADPIRIDTKNGKRWLRGWVIPKHLLDGFFLFWAKNKDSLRNKGYTVGKTQQNLWSLFEWREKLEDFRTHFGSDTTHGKVQPPEVVKRDIKIITESTLPKYEVKNVTGLREWQVPNVARLCAALERHGAAIDGSETGTGKTYSAVASARELGLKVAVVCPKAVITPWMKVIKNHFGMKPVFVLNYESVKTGKYKHIGTWKKVSKISNKEKFVWNVPSDTLIIFDESHKLKGLNTQNSEIAIAAKNQGLPILCCSATAAINPIETKALGYILGLYKSGKWTAYLRDHGCSQGRFGWEFSGDKRILSKLHGDIFLERGVRIKKSDVPDFPESEIIAESYDMDDSSKKELNKIYAEMDAELNTLKKKMKSAKEWKINAMVVQLRALQKSELIKVPLFMEMIEEAIEDGMSVAVFCNFTDTIEALAKRLKTKCIVWGKNKNQEERDKNIDDFQSDKSRVILLNSAAGGVGISLHDLNGNFPRMAIISPSHSVVMFKQVLGRVHRAGALSKSTQKILYVAGTAEENVCSNLQRKLNNLDAINDNDLSPMPIFEKSK